MDRCQLEGAQGDRLHAVLCATGYKICWLLRPAAMGSKSATPRLMHSQLASG